MRQEPAALTKKADNFEDEVDDLKLEKSQESQPGGVCSSFLLDDGIEFCVVVGIDVESWPCGQS